MDDTRTPRAFEVICSQIRAKLVAGELKPGDRLPTERELAAQHGVSRTAVREAMRSLEMFGLITLRKGRHGGAFILDNSAGLVSQNFRDMIDFGRISLETFFEARTRIAAAALCLTPGRTTEADFQRLFADLDEIDALTKAGAHEDRIAKVIRFSDNLAELSGNKMLHSIICASSQVIRGFADASHMAPYMPLTTGYRTVLTCLREGRVDDAADTFVAVSNSSSEHSLRIYTQSMSGME
ncbi:MAG: GntR family transcriptional regulator [Novosphingobium sp.]